MQRIAALAVILQVFALHMLLPAPALAQQAAGYRTVSTVSWIEEWDPVAARWVQVSETAAPAARGASEAPVPREALVRRTPSATITTRTYEARAYEATRFAIPSAASARPSAIAQYGPFLVLDGARAAMVGSTDAASPAQFDAMLRDFPGLAMLEMIEAPGTSNDIANLALGRRIRAAGIATHVPHGGSVRSGAVELFLAGVTRSIDPGAQFAVHSWLDNHGREPDDFAPDAPANRLYLDYYQEMGMSEERARAFYAMTNSVPHASARWLQADEMRDWISPEASRARQMQGTVPVVVPAMIPLEPLTLARAPLVLPAFAARTDERSDNQPNIRYGDVGAMNLASADPAAGRGRADAFLDS